MLGQLLRLDDHLAIGEAPRWADHRQGGAGNRRGEHQRMGDIVAITDIGEFQLAQVIHLLRQGHEIRQPLAGVVEIAEGVDHRYIAVLGELLHGAVGKGPGDDGIGPAGDILGKSATDSRTPMAPLF